MSVVLASVSKVLAKCRPSGDKVSARCRPTCLSVDVGRVSADISAEYRSICQPTVGRYIGR